MKLKDFNYIKQKALTKKNGIYTARGLTYYVKDNNVKYVATFGKLYEIYGVFSTIIGTYEWTGDASNKKALKELGI